MYTLSIRSTNELYDCINTVVLANALDVFNLGFAMKPVYFQSNGFKGKGHFTEYTYFELDRKLQQAIFGNHGGYNKNSDLIEVVEFIHRRFLNLMQATIPVFDDMLHCYCKFSDDRQEIRSTDKFFWDIIERWVNVYWTFMWTSARDMFGRDLRQIEFIGFLRRYYSPES